MDILFASLHTSLHFPPRIWWRLLPQRLQAMVIHYSRKYSALWQTSKRIVHIFLAAETKVQCLTFCFHPHFNVFTLSYTSVVSSSPSGQVCKLFIRHSWFVGFMCSRLTSVDIVWVCWFFTFQPHLDIHHCPPTEGFACHASQGCILAHSIEHNFTHVNLLVTTLNNQAFLSEFREIYHVIIIYIIVTSCYMPLLTCWFILHQWLTFSFFAIIIVSSPCPHCVL